ncbi:MAG: phage terminase large subunit family protein [Selenomonadaceae bacterium]|nr:phage terminase large subunit family protein [Selenomonadaceae bacterium]MBR4384124.1 phage terminase large subunit family protein [Selenomonadaceae bacterium]
MKTEAALKRFLSKLISPIKKIPVSKWADTFRQLPSDSAEPGQWRTSRIPYMQAVMDAFTDDRIHRVAIKSASQVGKSEVLLNIVGRFAHVDPCSLMIIQPTLELAQDFSKARLSRMVEDTKVLTPLFYDKAKTRDANQTILSKFFTGGRVVLTGANSPANLASRPIRILLCDEVDRFPQSAGGAKGEGDPVGLAARRTTTFWNYKIGLFSTPTTEGASRIDVEYQLGTQEEWRHKCPNCGEFHALDYRQMQVDFKQTRDESGNKSIVVNSVKWRCPDCGFEFSEAEMKNAPQHYEAQNPDAIKNGRRSFWLNGFSSPWLTWHEIIGEWLESRGDPYRESVVFNTLFGLSYKLTGDYSDENVFLERREDYDGEIPSPVLLLTAAVDVQANRLEYEICGWSAGFERWGILRGVIRGEPNFASTWRALDDVLDRVYFFGNGRPIKVARTFVDSGFATATVYDYCARNMSKGRFPIKGKSGMGLPLLYKYGNPKQTNVLLTILGVDDGKQEIMSRLGVTEGNGVLHFPRDDDFFKRRGYDADYFKQLISEHKVFRKAGGIVYQVWEPIIEHSRNESLDLAVYNLACVQSCVGNNPESFWRSQHEALRGDEMKTSRKKKARTSGKKNFVETDIWS